MLKYIILIISLILDGILSNFLPFMIDDLSLFTPMFTIVSLVLIYPLYHKENKKYLITVFVLGILYDLFYTNLFLLNGFLFVILGLLIIFLYKKFKINFIKIILYVIILIIAYECMVVILILLFNLVPVTLDKLIYKISHSLLLNMIYAELVYLILKCLPQRYMQDSIN